MKIDSTTTVSGGGLYGLDIELVEIVAVLDPAPPVLIAEVLPTTVSISHMYVDSGALDPDPGPGPGPDPDETLFYGEPSATFGYGGSPPYYACYPIGGWIGG